MNESVPLNRQDIEGLLARIAAEVSGEHEFILVGGAALACMDIRSSTTDIDTVSKLPAEIVAAVKRVAAAEGLAESFLNASATSFAPMGMTAEGEREVIATANVRFTLPHPNWLFLMKLNAARPGTDIEDMRRLWPLCSFSSSADVVKRFYEAYPNEPFDEFLGSFVDRIIRASTAMDRAVAAASQRDRDPYVPVAGHVNDGRPVKAHRRRRPT